MAGTGREQIGQRGLESGAERATHAAHVTGSRVSIDVPDDAERPLVVDPTWSGAGRLAFGRTGHTATLLGSGQVLIAGGRADDDAKSMTAELYDPATGRFTAATTLMKASRAQHTATLLRSEQVLLVGGLNRRRRSGRPRSSIRRAPRSVLRRNGLMGRPARLPGLAREIEGALDLTSPRLGRARRYFVIGAKVTQSG